MDTSHFFGATMTTNAMRESPTGRLSGGRTLCRCGPIESTARHIAAGVVTFVGMIVAMVCATAVAQSVRPADIYVAPGPSHTVYCQRSWDAGDCRVGGAVIGFIIATGRSGTR